MEPEADKLIMENISKNLSDADEYPAMMYVLGFDRLIGANELGTFKHDVFR